MKDGDMTPEAAERIAIRVLAWLASNDELMPVFLGTTGSSADALRAQSQDPAFLGAVMDFLLMDDAWIVAFCDAEALAYDVPMQVRQALPGGADRHWT